MKFVSVAEVKNRLTVYLAQARKKKEPIIVTHHGKPYPHPANLRARSGRVRMGSTWSRSSPKSMGR